MYIDTKYSGPGATRRIEKGHTHTMRKASKNSSAYVIQNLCLAIVLVTGTVFLLTFAERHDAPLHELVTIVMGGFGFGGLAFLLLHSIHSR